MNHDLVACLRAALAEYRFTQTDDVFQVDGADAVVFVAPRWLGSRYVCAVVAVPENVQTFQQVRQLFDAARIALAKQYAGFPYWKQIGTFLVLIVGSQLFEAAEDQLGQCKDRTGMHTNVMLGTVLVDCESPRSRSEATWGLFYSGRYYRAIQRAVDDWCRRQASPIAADNP
jgi:hypothetical protein